VQERGHAKPRKGAMRKGGVLLPLQYDISQVRSAIIIQSNVGSEIRRAFVSAKCGTFSQPPSEGKNSRTVNLLKARILMSASPASV
jgi:hypothetical protein